LNKEVNSEIQLAFIECYKPYHKQLNLYCLALSKNEDDAKDLMGSTLEIAFKKFESLKDRGKFKYFIFGIASKITNNERRKWSNKIFVSDTNLNQQISSNQDSEQSADYYFLHQALQRLKQSTREAIVLFELEGFSIKEIAEIQNTNENTIKTRLSRGRAELKSILNPNINFQNAVLK
jgi:RNA polymerase sigma-70 factor (ECF subfamily)